MHSESRAYDLLLSISLNMYLAQKEAWERRGRERCRESSPALWSHRWGNQHSENTLPAPQIWSGIKYSLWKTYQDINIMVEIDLSSSSCDVCPLGMPHISPGLVNSEPVFWPE